MELKFNKLLTLKGLNINEIRKKYPHLFWDCTAKPVDWVFELGFMGFLGFGRIDFKDFQG
jgi:hypothetical protein